MNAWLAIPLEIRTAIVFLLGGVLGGQINRGIYRLAWHPRAIGPWSPPHPAAAPRGRFDRLPIVGWLFLRRESPVHGLGFWVRPLLIELFAAIGFAGLYWHEMHGRLLPQVAAAPDPVLLHAQFFAHLVLLSLMAVATFIDFDEQTIPDAITLPGAMLGLTILALLPAAALPVLQYEPLPPSVSHLRLVSPLDWPADYDGQRGLLIGLLCLAGWSLAVWPKTVTLRRGPVKAVQFAVVSMFRYAFWPVILVATLVACGCIALVWSIGGESWRSLLSALVGMAFGGGLIWSIRIVGRGALGKEAMGFGDVTLMAMIGAFVGWQPCLIIFFLAPFVAVVICVVQWLLTRRRDIAFGPYLCAATLIVILRWPEIWEHQARGVFALGFVPQLLFFCIVLMGGLLMMWRIAERLLFGGRR